MDKVMEEFTDDWKPFLSPRGPRKKSIMESLTDGQRRNVVITHSTQLQDDINLYDELNYGELKLVLQLYVHSMSNQKILDMVGKIIHSDEDFKGMSKKGMNDLGNGDGYALFQCKRRSVGPW